MDPIQVGTHAFKFDHPAFLQWWALLAVVVYVLIVRGLIDWLARTDVRRDRTSPRLSLAGHIVSTLGWCLVGLLLFMALSYPYEPNQALRVPEGTIYAAFGFDGSPSADAEDYRDILPTPALPDGSSPKPIGPWGSRDQVARWLAVNKLMNVLPNNKIALIAYTADARAVSPLRDDYDTLRWILTKTNWLTAPGGGSDPAEALKACIETLRKQYIDDQEAAAPRHVKMKRQIIVIFSDGGITDLEKEKGQEAKEIWERDFERILKDLAGLKAQAEQDGVAPPLVVLMGMGGEQKIPVPLYYTDGERVRNDAGEPLFFSSKKPDEGVTAAENPDTTGIEEENLRMLERRIGAVVTCKYQRIPLNWQEIENLNLVENIFGGEKTTLGKHYYWEYPLIAAMALIVLLFVRGRFRPSDDIGSRRAIPSR